MAIYKQDKITTSDGKVHGEKVTGDELRMPYKMFNSLNQKGVTYIFSHMDNGEAVYVRSHISQVEERIDIKINTKVNLNSSGENIIRRSELPSGAILSPDFVGRTIISNGRRYKMMQPVTKCDGQYVMIEA
jgi:hypothetical protein